MKNGLEVRYQAALSRSNYEGQVHWARFNAMLIVNTIFLTIIGFTFDRDFLPVSRQILAILGIVLCFLWFQVTKRGLMWTRFWITKAREIEELESRKYPINPFIEGLKHKKLSDEVFNSQNSSFIIIGIFLLIYFFVLLT